MRVILSDRAIEDLRDIGLYISRDNPVRAMTFVDELEVHCLSLSDQPDRGVLRGRLIPRLRLLIHRAYNIYYLRNDKGIRIMRLVHSARRVTRKDFA